MLYKHWSDFPKAEWRWKNFSPEEHGMHCPCCGEYYHDPVALDKLQYARTVFGKALRINSSHRCRKHNRAVGGALNSQHLRVAFDVSTRGHNRYQVLAALKQAGFTTFGYYNTFIHTDTRRGRRWYGKGARKSWKF